VPLADKSCTLSIINRVVEYLKKHAEFEASNADDEVHFYLGFAFPSLVKWAGRLPQPPPQGAGGNTLADMCTCGLFFPCGAWPWQPR
jgi:hypothetical protein